MTSNTGLPKVKEQLIVMTPERIDTLMQIVDEEKGYLEYSNGYLEMLNRWKQGDFSVVDDDHNFLKDVLRKGNLRSDSYCFKRIGEQLHIPSLWPSRQVVVPGTWICALYFWIYIYRQPAVSHPSSLNLKIYPHNLLIFPC
ncbi:MAG: DUF6241 domain-containing protein [Lysinibacillus sp.]